MKRSAPLAALLALLLAAAAVAPVAAATPSPTDGATAPPADPETDVLGWEDGYWYNESVSVTRSDGLNDTELDAVVSRAMARVEEVRRLEFAARPPVEVIGREAYADRIAGSFENVSTEERLFHDTLAEARFFAGEGRAGPPRSAN
ncbi:hypothetical protein [Halosegnis marinus]|uniref:hypothetical protein n=1 Tax=Halosegnis marinus TaxID=3034023 RepID=UPI00360DB247